MKLIYKSGEDYKVYDHEIMGYKCQVHETLNSGSIVSVPFGDNEKEKTMFDQLVYFSKPNYRGKNKKEAVKNVSDWIKNYKEQND